MRARHRSGVPVQLLADVPSVRRGHTRLGQVGTENDGNGSFFFPPLSFALSSPAVALCHNRGVMTLLGLALVCLHA